MILSIDTNTLYYYFSTIAQSYAALTALFFGFAQFKMARIEDRIFILKRNILNIKNGFSPERIAQTELEARITNSVALQQWTSKTQNDEYVVLGLKLGELEKELSEFKGTCGIFIASGLTLTVLGTSGILYTNFLTNRPFLGFIVISIFLFAISIVTFIMGRIMLKILWE